MYFLIIAISSSNPDHIVEVINGEFVRVVKGNKSIKEWLQDHRDEKIQDSGVRKDRLTSAEKTKFNTIHRVNSR